MSNEALDRAVAEKIMGNPEPVAEGPQRSGAWLTKNGWSGKAKTHSNGLDVWYPPHYSTDPRLTMLVVEEMRKTHELELEFSIDRFCARLHPYFSMRELPSCILGSGVDVWQSTFLVAALRSRGHSTEGL